MKRFPFLLLDTGPIIKLFQLGTWDDFIKRCTVTISRIVANEAKWASKEFEDIRIDLTSCEQADLIKVIDLDLSLVKTFYDRFDLQYKAEINDGEKEVLAFLWASDENWLVCSSDHAVFRVLGLLGKPDQGISLQEVLDSIGLSKSNLESEYTKSFREKWTRKGQIDSIQEKGIS